MSTNNLLPFESGGMIWRLSKFINRTHLIVVVDLRRRRSQSFRSHGEILVAGRAWLQRRIMPTTVMESPEGKTKA